MRSLPKSLQISEMLIREIASGRLPDGARLPTERDMAHQYGIAIGTLRKALATIEEKGLLRRVQGSGNYVQAKSNVDSVYAFFRLELLEGGGLPTANVLSVRKLSTPDAAKRFQSKKSHRIRRIRCLSDVRVAAEEIWLDGRFAETISKSDLSESLYHYYNTAFGLIISRVEDRIRTSNMPSWAPDVLELSAGAPCGFIERFGYDQSNSFVEYSRTWFNQNRAQYVSRLM